jgi:hypothetical protein
MRHYLKNEFRNKYKRKVGSSWHMDETYIKMVYWPDSLESAQSGPRCAWAVEMM